MQKYPLFIFDKSGFLYSRFYKAKLTFGIFVIMSYFLSEGIILHVNLWLHGPGVSIFSLKNHIAFI